MGRKAKLNIEDCVNELELSKWFDGIDKYIITETFSKRGTVSFVIENLTIEYDDNVIWAEDNHGMLIDKNSVLSMFFRKDLLSINKHPKVGHFYVQFKFKDGIIIIESYLD